MTISCLDKEDDTVRLVCLIALLYLDTISYTKIFSYLKENYSFYPKVIHLDYEAPLRNAIINSGVFEEKPLLVSCFFHFSANIRRKMEKLKITGKKFNKMAIEILRNIELLCFIKPKNIKKFSEILKENLNKNERHKKLYQYVYNYYIKKKPEIYNYSFIIDYTKDKSKEKYLKKLYLTNNIEESMHSKINFYLGKKSTTNNMFINAVQNIFTSDELKKENLIRYDYVTQTLIALIETLKFNDSLRWISYDQYIKFNSLIIKKIKGDIDSSAEENLINLINRLNIKESSEEVDDKIKKPDSMESNEDESDELNNSNELENENKSLDSDLELDNSKNLIDLVDIEDSMKSSDKEKEVIDSQNDTYFKKSLRERLKDKSEIKNININIIDDIFKNENEKEDIGLNNINLLNLIYY